MKPKFSIVVPVYNVQDYLRDCIESIINQTYTNYELILINDGSTDSSEDICKSYLNLDNVFLYNQINNGVSSARNLGLDFCTGDYIVFVDSDDWININYLESFYEVIKENDNLNVIQCANFKHTKDAIIKPKMLRGYYDLNKYIRTPNFPYAIFSFCIKRKLISKYNLCFNTKLKYAEDLDFITRVLLYSEDVQCIDTTIYNYRIRDNSAMNTPVSYKSSIDNLTVAKDLLSIIPSSNFNCNQIDFLIYRAKKNINSFFVRLSKCNLISSELEEAKIFYRSFYKTYRSIGKLNFLFYRLAYYNMKIALMFVKLYWR